VEGIKRPHLGERAWRELMRRFDGSGMSAVEFCKRERLSKTTFHRWRERLMAQSPVDASTAQREVSTAGFVDLGALARADNAMWRLEIKLDLGSGLTLHLVRG
jgi:putative transposase